MRHARPIVLICGALVFMALGTYAVFTVRKPVVVVTDALFDELYGRRRIEYQRRAASLVLFRRILAASVADTATPLAAADAAAAASARPSCVIFPSRYEEGASSYRERYADIPVVVLGDETAPDAFGGGGRSIRFTIDKETDRYRAGRMAGFLCAEDERPLVITTSAPDSLEAFIAGLVDSSFAGEPIVLPPGDPPPSAARIGCVVVLEAEVGNLQPELRRFPVVFFSWIDLALAPSGTVAVFDDSLWAVIVSAVRGALGKRAGVAPSKVWFPVNPVKKTSREVRAAAVARYEVHNSL